MIIVVPSSDRLTACTATLGPKFKDRLSEHGDYSKRDVITEPSVRHFTQPGNNVADMKGLVSKKSGIKTQTF